MSNVIHFPLLLREARALNQQAARYRTFTEATGLRRPSRRSLAWPPGFDHTRLWLDRAGKYIVTTEPYRKTAADFAHLASQGWTLADAPDGYGLWNPPDARLILASPPQRGGNLAPVIEAVAALQQTSRPLVDIGGRA